MTCSVDCNAYLEILLKELLVRLLHDLRLGSKLGVVRQSVHLVDENLEPAQQASIKRRSIFQIDDVIVTAWIALVHT